MSQTENPESTESTKSTESIAILISAGPVGEDFVRFLGSRGVAVTSPPTEHASRDVRGPYLPLLVAARVEEIEGLVAEFRRATGVGAQFQRARTPDARPDLPTAWITFPQGW